MFRILARIPDQQVMVQTEVRPQESVSPEAHHLVPTLHAPYMPVPIPRLAPPEEVGDHVI